MNKTIYLPDDEAETWDKARRLANDRLSPVILKALKEYIMTKEAASSEAAGFERIELEFEDSDDNHLPKKKAFHGKWIFSPRDPFPPREPFDGSEKRVYAIAVTSKGNVAVYTWIDELSFPDDHRYGYRFLVFRSLEEAAVDHDFNQPIRAAMRQRGVPVEELDI
jgi:hypothetical protein